MAGMVLYLTRSLLIGIAVGVLFIRCRLFRKMSKPQIFMINIAGTPMFISFLDYLLGLIFVGWSSIFFCLAPAVAALIWLLCMKNYRLAIEAARDGFRYWKAEVNVLGKWLLLDGMAASAVVIFYCCIFNFEPEFTSFKAFAVRHMNRAGYCVLFFFVVCAAIAAGYMIWQMVRERSLLKNMLIIKFLTIVGCQLFLGLSMNSRPLIDSDRSHYELDARYFADDKNSWVIDDYEDERRGSSFSDDHGPLWIVNLADAHILADALGLDDPLRMTNFAILWTYVCFNVLLFMTASFLANTKKAGIIALCGFDCYRYEIMMIFGSRDAFRFIGLLLLLFYTYNMTCELTEKRTKWYHCLFTALFCYWSMEGHESNVYIMLGMYMCLGIYMITCHIPFSRMFLFGMSVLTGTLVGIAKTIKIFFSTGRLATSTLSVFYGTPVVEQVKAINDRRADWAAIAVSYTSPERFLIIFGLIALVILLIVSFKKKDQKSFIFGLMIFGMLLPLTGIMDWIGYECSRWFVEQLRYRMYFLMLFAITAGWLLTRRWMTLKTGLWFMAAAFIWFVIFLQEENMKMKIYSKQYVRYCEEIIDEYKRTAELADAVTEGNVFVQNQVLLYYLHGTPKLLYHQYSEPLIQAKNDREVEAAIKCLGLGAVILPENGLDYHDYSLLPFWYYVKESGRFGVIDLEEYDIYYLKDRAVSETQ